MNYISVTRGIHVAEEQKFLGSFSKTENRKCVQP